MWGYVWRLRSLGGCDRIGLHEAKLKEGEPALESKVMVGRQCREIHHGPGSASRKEFLQNHVHPFRLTLFANPAAHGKTYHSSEKIMNITEERQ